MGKRDFVTFDGITREQILYMIEMTQEFERHPNREILKGKVVATLFFEPSTRTRLSFETAANRLGARVIGFADPKVTSGTKGETLKDTIMMVSNYADVIVMRHYIEGAARYASEVSPVPIVNAGDGAHQHPSQCMLDLYSIYKTQGTLENLNIYMVGDLKYGRTVHSLLMAMRHFNPTFHFVAPKELAMPKEYKQYCEANDGRALTRRFPISEALNFTALIPPFELSTALARSVLPESVSREDAIFNVSRAALLLRALGDGDAELLAFAMDDRIHQPYRARLIDGFSHARIEAQECGAAGICISGAGSTLLCVASRPDFPERMETALSMALPGWELKVLTPDLNGAMIAAL